jgi:uncharacterized protein (TIGR02246 family)
MQHHNALLEVLTASQRWVEHFNRGAAEACAQGYTDDAVMHASPMGVFQGRTAILEFWRPFIESGATDLVYSHVSLRVEGDDRVRLSAQWTMNVGRGVITNELWMRQPDGSWKLVEDHFEVQEQFEPAA